MIVEERRGWFRKVFIPLDSESAMQVARGKKKYSRIQIVSLSPLELPGFRLKRRRTGIIKLGGSMEEIIGSFDRTSRNNIHRADRDAGLRFEMRPRVTDEGYALVVRFVHARGLTPHPRSYYEGCVEFLAFADNEPVSGIFIFPSTPVGLLAAVFSKRHEDCSHEAYKRVGYASKRLMANVCGWGIDHGMTDIDMGGLNLDATDKAGIANSKMAFNPIVAEQYVYTYSSPTFSVLEHVMVRLRALQRFFRAA